MNIPSTTQAQSSIQKLQELVSLKDEKKFLRDPALGLEILENNFLDLDSLVKLVSIYRFENFGNRVQVHIINNLRNGYCPEDCSYCAQRRDKDAGPIFKYTEKSDEEILWEAKKAREKGAYRYCMVSAGRGPNAKSIKRYASLCQKIKLAYPELELCLSAGILTSFADAQTLAQAGLDRYNHNLNTSERHYPKICSSHTYQDRLETIKTIKKAGLGTCSGLIVGMGEDSQDIVEASLELQNQKVDSIPINFFLPVENHKVPTAKKLTYEYCMRVLCLLRFTNPQAEIRLGAGRELYFKKAKEAFLIANSLFVSGYLNVKGSDAYKTIQELEDNGYEIQSSFLKDKKELYTKNLNLPSLAKNEMKMKTKKDLRPYLEK